jgi:hypothetical protein
MSTRVTLQFDVSRVSSAQRPRPVMFPVSATFAEFVNKCNLTVTRLLGRTVRCAWLELDGLGVVVEESFEAIRDGDCITVVCAPAQVQSERVAARATPSPAPLKPAKHAAITSIDDTVVETGGTYRMRKFVNPVRDRASRERARQLLGTAIDDGDDDDFAVAMPPDGTRRHSGDFGSSELDDLGRATSAHDELSPASNLAALGRATSADGAFADNLFSLGLHVAPKEPLPEYAQQWLNFSDRSDNSARNSARSRAQPPVAELVAPAVPRSPPRLARSPQPPTLSRRAPTPRAAAAPAPSVAPRAAMLSPPPPSKPVKSPDVVKRGEAARAMAAAPGTPMLDGLPAPLLTPALAKQVSSRDGPYSCPQCFKAYPTAADVLYHIQKRHAVATESRFAKSMN